MADSRAPRVLASGLGKDFKIYRRPPDRLKELLTRRPHHQVHQVLDDISFMVPDGGSLGIVGDNGSGKSTLLKLVVGTLQPTRGQVQTSGQVAALLELGAGFHPEFSGRKNIHLNASLMGVPDLEIDALENAIIEFSELAQVIDRPVKTYSSGMYVRLAFSIAAMVNPDILVIDEALSVGDMAFQRKCVERINQYRSANKTLVFCSHSMYHIQEVCDTAIWLDKGRIRAMGDCQDVVSRYEDHCAAFHVQHRGDSDLPAAEAPPAATEKDCKINALAVTDRAGKPLAEVAPLADLRLEMEVEALRDCQAVNFGFAFMRDTDEFIAAFFSKADDNVDSGPFTKGEVIRVSLTVRNFPLRSGSFHVLCGLSEGTGLLWYETRRSPTLGVAADKGLGPVTMASEWASSKAPRG